MSRQKDLDRVCEYRKLPPLKIGAECEVDGKKGIIVGGNCSANLNVLFDGENHYNNCHPWYRMRIFNGMGGLCYESDDLYTAPCPDCGAVQPVDCETEHVCPD
jgi:hypothetical protein